MPGYLFWMDIDAYNVPSKYTRKILPMLSIVVEEPLVITYKLLNCYIQMLSITERNEF
jgi:hypothetical protein